METKAYAKIAVSAAIYSIDRPYTYFIPEALRGKVKPGVRVSVPFGAGNHHCEGFVLVLEENSDYKEVKPIESALDEEPVLTEEQIKLALWMRDRFFCTLYDALKSMLPVGMWYKNGRRRVGDKTETFVRLAVHPEEAVIAAGQKKGRAPMQSAVLNLMVSVGEAAVSDIAEFTGARTATVNTLIKQGFLDCEIRQVFRYQGANDAPTAGPIKLNDDQQQVYSGLSGLLNSDKPEAALLFGVTGSGKTLIYIKLAAEAVDLGKRAIILVPEISLTPQAVRIFSSHFGKNVAVLHSSLTMGERYDEWKRIKSGEVMVVIGTRSAIFAPVENLGLIIIDEEQEHTYKSESNPRYNARGVAKYKCAKSNALLLLGSATPSVESMYFAKNGRYSYFELKERFNKRNLPHVSIVNMRDELRNGNGGAFSEKLIEELGENISKGEQSILFINRRGAASAVVCGECGYTFMCPNCSVSMTLHSYEKKLMCHYCGHSESVPTKCPECGGKLKFMGTGTQKIEEEINRLFPGTETVRMDSDTVARVGSHEKLLERFRKENVPILLGTQMITKGLDFENVTLVGVMNADQSLYSGSFRSRERTFSLITQVVGRSGRGEKMGRAVIQTYTPENETIVLAARQDYESFFYKEIELRKIISAPPVSDMISVCLSGIDEALVLRGCVKLLNTFKYYFGNSVNVLGPSPDGVTKVNNRYRYKLVLIGKNTKRVRDTISHVIREFSSDKGFRGVSAYADADPTD